MGPVRWSLLLLCVAVALAPANVRAQSVYLVGTVGQAPVLMTLERDGKALNGWYLYLRYGKQILLSGQIDSHGKFTLSETGTDSKLKPGVFAGITSRSDWSGSWQRPGSGSLVGFALHEDTDRLSALNGRFHCATKKVDRQFGYTYTHTLDLAVARGAVTKLAIDRTARSSADENQCSIDLSTLEPASSRAGILLRSRGDQPSNDDSELHCSVRILGSADYLYVVMGESNEKNNDCRGAADTMYCSARGTWTDLVVDRRTGRCISVE